MRKQVVLLAAALILPSLGAKAAGLVVWWQKGYYNQEDDAIRETIAAFEQETGKQVELVIEPAGGTSRQPVGRNRSGSPARFRFQQSHSGIQYGMGI
jgi:ABC-type glycerol-3-phosphate transport system substrate-binding protein